MGSTLEHGIYLPSEGEKNCYQGLAGNWQAVDTNIGYITALRQAIAGALTRQIVTQLPTEDIDPNCIYMILKATAQTNNIYDEYMYINSNWELIGDSQLDLSNYYTKQEVNQLPAVASGVTSTKVGNYDAHIANGDIHVTASDKTKWTNSANTHVLRLALSALTPSTSDNSFSNLDDSTALKVGDKVMDTAGVLFEVTAIDTANSTFTIGTALIDLAQDSNVVHKSGNETITGTKTFLDVPIPFKSSTAELGVTGGNTKVIFTDKNLLNLAGITFGNYGSSKLSYCRFHIYDKDSNNQEVENFIEFSYVNNNQLAYFRPNKSNFVTLGAVNNRWSKVYADEYYYGSNNVEFSIKFVTTDTAQTISGVKTFTNDLLIYNSDTTAYASYLNLKNQKVARGSSETGSQGIQYQDKNSKTLTMLESRVVSNGNTAFNIICYNIDGNNQTVSDGVTIIKSPTITNFAPTTDNAVTCGRTLAKWSDVQTYKVNGLEPSSLSLPSGNVNDVIDISSYLVNLDGTANTYTAPANGWISISMSGCTGIQAYINGLWGNQIVRPSVGGVRFLMPVVKNLTVNILIFGGAIDNARFILCQGNV